MPSTSASAYQTTASTLNIIPSIPKSWASASTTVSQTYPMNTHGHSDEEWLYNGLGLSTGRIRLEGGWMALQAEESSEQSATTACHIPFICFPNCLHAISSSHRTVLGSLRHWVKNMQQGAYKPVDSQGRLRAVQPKEYMKKLDGEILLGNIESTLAQMDLRRMADKDNP